MEQKKPATWIRFAVRGDKIRAGSPYAWRAIVGKEPEIALKGWCTEGVSSHKNPVPGFNYTPDEYGVLAWVAYFGTYSIKDDIMYIKQEEPTSPPPRAAQQ